MSDYSPSLVKNLLVNYLTLREFLWEGTASQSPTAQYIHKGNGVREKPLGATSRNPFPFMEKPHASSKVDGKKKARSREELLVMILDLEAALSRMKAEDRALLLSYYTLDRVTLHDLSIYYGLSIEWARKHVSKRLIDLTVRMNDGR